MILDKIISAKINIEDTHTKSLLKSISWRIIGTLDTVLISWYLTKTLSIALSIGSIEIFTKFILYYLHERVWNITKQK